MLPTTLCSRLRSTEGVRHSSGSFTCCTSAVAPRSTAWFGRSPVQICLTPRKNNTFFSLINLLKKKKKKKKELNYNTLYQHRQIYYFLIRRVSISPLKDLPFSLNEISSHKKIHQITSKGSLVTVSNRYSLSSILSSQPLSYLSHIAADNSGSWASGSREAGFLV